MYIFTKRETRTSDLFDLLLSLILYLQGAAVFIARLLQSTLIAEHKFCARGRADRLAAKKSSFRRRNRMTTADVTFYRDDPRGRRFRVRSTDFAYPGAARDGTRTDIFHILHIRYVRVRRRTLLSTAVLKLCPARVI